MLGFFSAIMLFFQLNLAQASVQAIETLFPKDAVMFEPVGNFFERTRLKPTRPPAA
jgi:hypothetical protein